MVHRHLNHEKFTAAAIDSVISRGGRADWEELHAAVRTDASLLDKIRQVCQPNVIDPRAQRYHFWMRYVQERTTP